jgi:hypothetical protein
MDNHVVRNCQLGKDLAEWQPFDAEEETELMFQHANMRHLLGLRTRPGRYLAASEAGSLAARFVVAVVTHVFRLQGEDNGEARREAGAQVVWTESNFPVLRTFLVPFVEQLFLA